MCPLDRDLAEGVPVWCEPNRKNGRFKPALTGSS
jgi:hypothetical protein